jgi:HAD superfamily hydrolase (TIGR01457 family)
MKGIKAVLLDMDGTVFRGRTAIKGAAKALDRLRGSGVKIFFLTNSSTRTRKSNMEKLNAIGLHASEGEVFGSAYLVADYIATKYPGRKVFCISEGGMQEELAGKGVKVVQDDSADIIAVGLDRTLNYEKLAIAFKAISRGALFIASNEDISFPVEDGFLPGAGAMVAAVERSTGKKPVVLGKPNRYGVELLLRENGLKKSEALMVGDRIETDILTGKHAGVRSVLVLTGASKKADIKRLRERERPDFVIESVAKLPELISRLES